MRVLLRAPLGAYSGWGQDGVGLAKALIRAGHEVFVLPLEVTPPLPALVAERLQVALEPPFDLVLSHVSTEQAALPAALRYAAAPHVLWSMWEWTSFANHPRRDEIADSAGDYDLIVAYDPVSASAFRSLPGAEQLPIVTVQGGFDANAWAPLDREWRSPIRFFMAGHLTERKNPTAAIDAFTQLQAMTAATELRTELHLKFVDRSNAIASSHPHPPTFDLLPGASRPFAEAANSASGVFVHIGTWGRAELAGFYRRMHCLLAPSQGEGKNLVALEFLAGGGTVIATDFGGHSMWLDDSVGYPLSRRLQPATWPIATDRSENARVEVDELAERMWQVCADPDEARRRGAHAAEVIPRRHSWDRALSNLMDEVCSRGLVRRQD